MAGTGWPEGCCKARSRRRRGKVWSGPCSEASPHDQMRRTSMHKTELKAGALIGYRVYAADGEAGALRDLVLEPGVADPLPGGRCGRLGAEPRGVGAPRALGGVDEARREVETGLSIDEVRNSPSLAAGRRWCATSRRTGTATMAGSSTGRPRSTSRPHPNRRFPRHRRPGAAAWRGECVRARAAARGGPARLARGHHRPGHAAAGRPAGRRQRLAHRFFRGRGRFQRRRVRSAAWWTRTT
jgi:hypothetical protein